MGSERELTPEHNQTEAGQLVMPFYVVCDVSWSMFNDISQLNDGLRRLIRAIRAEPIVDDVARIGVISFSDTARVVMPLGQASDSGLQDLQLEGGTNYGAAFRALKATIDTDISELKSRGLKVFRPCAFFLSDGEPLDSDWRATFTSTLTYDKERKVGNSRHPIVVPFGFRDALEADIKYLAYPPGKGKWFFARTNKIEEALKGIVGVIMQTTMTTAKTAFPNIQNNPQKLGSPKPELQVSEPPPGSGLSSGESEYEDDFVD